MSKADPSTVLGMTLVLVAHQDDETVGCGALLQRMREPCVVFATDGAPQAPYFWKRYKSREQYRSVRRREAERALWQIGVERIFFFSAPDQELYRHLPEALRQLLHLSADLRPDALLTHAYEGGHPDHDCCAFLSAAAGKLVRLPVWEMPLYWRGKDQIVRQQPLSVPGASEAIAVVPSKSEMSRKKRMAASHRSQRHVIGEFSLGVEYVRPQPDYDFTRPPHPGPVNYESWGWSVRAADLCSAFQEIQDHL